VWIYFWILPTFVWLVPAAAVTLVAVDPLLDAPVAVDQFVAVAAGVERARPETAAENAVCLVGKGPIWEPCVALRHRAAELAVGAGAGAVADAVADAAVVAHSLDIEGLA
jgi:hypothetical protein